MRNSLEDSIIYADPILLASYETANPEYICRHQHWASECQQCRQLGPFGPKDIRPLLEPSDLD